MFSLAMEDDWKHKSEGVASFKMPTMQHGTLQNEDVLHKGYRPKMLLYTLDELFYIYDQVKHHRGIDEKLVVAYDILGLTVLHCTEHRGGVKKQGMPDALSQINLNDTCHLEHLTWAVYDGALLVESQPELPGDHQWCTVPASIYKHIYRGHNDAAHCPPYTLASWDYQQRTEVLCEEQRQVAVQSSYKNAPRARRRSRSSFRHHSRMLSHRGWSGYSCCSPPNMLLRCHCGEPLFPSLNTMPMLSSAVSVPACARSSHSVGGWHRPPWMTMKTGRTSRPHTPLYATWFSKRGQTG